MYDTPITFIDKYWEYGGSHCINGRVPTIGCYKSAWLADLITSFILDSTTNLFGNATSHYGIYRDDEIDISKHI